MTTSDVDESARVADPDTLAEALAVPDLEDAESVRSLWDELAADAVTGDEPGRADGGDLPAPIEARQRPVDVRPTPGTGEPASGTVEPASGTEEPLVGPDDPEVAESGRLEAAPAATAGAAAVAARAEPVEAEDAEDEPLHAVADRLTVGDRLTRGERKVARRAARQAKRAVKMQKRSDRLALRRHRILPRTVIGITTILLFFALGAGLSGAILYTYYDWRLGENETRVGVLAETLESRLQEANDDIAAAQSSAVQDIRRESSGLQDLLADVSTVGDLTPGLAESVWFVETLGEEGEPSVGSAFVASSDGTESLMVTSYTTVAAATTTPGPEVRVTAGDREVVAEVYNWDVDRDLALLVVPVADLPALTWAGDDVVAELTGKQVYAVSGLGGSGASLSPGLVVDQSAAGLQHNAAVGSSFQGGPIVTSAGEVVGVASLAYAPLNFEPGLVPFAVPVRGACERVLNCSGDIPGAG